MWKFNPFKPKEQTGLEGRIIDIGNVKVQVGNVIAEGGFSCVYLARDVLHGSKQYALKHIICNDEESLELVMKEISVLKSLKGHPNVVTLHAHAMFDMGRTKEAILVMEYCEKSLVNVLESRGAAFFEEKKILTIFRDVCNAVFAMHCQSPPIAHRDLKAENLLLGPDDLWKLCDFGSTSTNHKRFEKPEEMGIEEDNIRKHTTPAYRAPEMWDLYRKEIINEKVDIWALGCLLFRISYFKSAFDGESKLQVLNGNYRIPDLPKYSTSITDLIRDMLQSSPDDRPDITQVWFRVNNLLPEGMQKSLPDRPPEMQQNSNVLEGTSKPSSKPMPHRSATPPNSGAESARQVSSASQNPRTGGSSGPLGAFWTTQHAQDSVVSEDLTTSSSLRHDSTRSDPGKERPNAPKKDIKPAYQGDAFNAFVAEFSNTKLNPESKMRKSENEEVLVAEIENIKTQLAQANVEKAEITSKYEKLSAICRSQRQEIQELKQALNAKTPSPGRDAFQTQASSDQRKTQASPSSQSSRTPQGREQGFDKRIPSAEPNMWQAFADDSKPHTTLTNNDRKSVRTRNDQHTSQSAQENSGAGTWGFESDKFRAVPTSSPQISIHGGTLGNSQRFGESKKIESMPASQPAGWAGF